MPASIQLQFVYYDKKSTDPHISHATPKPKGKLAGVIIAEVYSFFELTSVRSRINERHRVDIEQEHLENLQFGYLTGDEGCIKLIEPEYLSVEEIDKKIADRRNGFKNIARLCDEKWSEVQRKCRSEDFRRTPRAITRRQQAEIVRLTTDPDYEDAEWIIEQLGLD